MNRIEKKFAELREMRRVALMPYLPLGYPTRDISRQLIRAVAEAGADMIELGVPFSDPLADGPVIQRATQVALENGMSLSACLEITRAARADGVAIPLVLMGYYNPILRYGVEKFARDAADAGADGFIVPDLPPEEADALDAECRARDLDLVFLAAPTSPQARLQKIANATRGFVYLVSVTGVTGARAELSADLPAFIARVRATTSKPVCVGFGIAHASAARRVAQIADGVIVGSALVARLAAPDPIHAARALIAEWRDAMDSL